MNPCPFYHLVPKDAVENIRWRRWVLRKGAEDPAFARLVRAMCKADPLFFINLFVLIYEPREGTPDGLPSVRPFNTYAFQDEAIIEDLPHLGRKDIGVEKSREQGASWLYLAVTMWRWQFYPLGDYMLVSRNEKMVDSLEDRDSLFVKTHWMIEKQPSWLRPAYTRSELRIVNKDLGGVITGAATTDSVGVGGRKTWILFDEFARFSLAFGNEVLAVTQHTTNCRIFISTPKGDVGAYYFVMVKRPAKTIIRHRFHWSRHPAQRRGMYRKRGDVVEFFCTYCYSEIAVPETMLCPACAAAGRKADPYPFPPDYEFGSCDKFKVRSPWFDGHANQAQTDQYIARELEIDYGGSVEGVFDGVDIAKLIERDAREPDVLLELRAFLADRNTRLFIDAEAEESFWSELGRVFIQYWGPIENGCPPADLSFVAASDISAGTGASNSVFSAFDSAGHKRCQLVSNRIPPTQFSRIVVQLCRWLRGPSGGAYLIWEHEGPGIPFGQEVLNQRYEPVYYQRNEQTVSMKQTDRPGWSPTEQNKLAAFEQYANALRDGRVKNHSRQALEQCREFIIDDNGRIRHKAELSADTPTGRKKYHGDIVMADVMAWLLLSKHFTESSKKAEEVVPVGSVKWRLAQQPKRRHHLGTSRWTEIRRAAG